MTCPMGYTSSMAPFVGRGQAGETEDEAQKGYNAVKSGGTTYSEYLKLDKLLTAQEPLSFKHKRVDDEHLFIIIHQAYELWFKQILFDLDAVRDMFRHLVLDESESLKITSKLERIVKIMNLLCDQMMILETMSPLDFIEFRTYLTPASGFQSLQFRLLENKLGVRPENRTRYNAQHYNEVFKEPEDRELLNKSEKDPSLLTLVESWLGRTPGINTAFQFWPKYCRSVQQFLHDSYSKLDTIQCPIKKEQEMCEIKKLEESYESILNREIHESYIKKGSRRLSHEAMQGALMIFFYRDMPRFSQPYKILTLLMDLDSLMERWRHNHVILVQRMLGTKQGTGGSSGYMYLRSTCSDRYKVFLDLFNLSTWLIPRCYIPKLSRHLERKLSYFDPGFFSGLALTPHVGDKSQSSGDNRDEDETSDSDFAE